MGHTLKRTGGIRRRETLNFYLCISPWLVGFVLFVLGPMVTSLGVSLTRWNLIGTPESQGFKTYFLFGIAYGMASLGCTLPVFMVVVGSAMKSQGFTEGIFQFLSYSLGMGAVLTALALSMAVFHGGLATYLRRVLPFENGCRGDVVHQMGSQASGSL